MNDIQKHSHSKTAGEGNSPRPLKEKILSELIDWIKILTIAAIGAWLCNTFLLMNTEIPTGSMEDTIPTGSRIISSRVHYWFSDPERGDVILFEPPDWTNPI